MEAPPLTWLFAPAHRPDRVEKALASRAHAVIVDLEDGVPRAAKKEARAHLGTLLRARSEKRVLVRVTRGDDADLEAVAGLPLAGVVVPKVERLEDVPGGLAVYAMVESARGVEAAFEIASHPGVRGISLGEEDLRSQLGASEEGLDWQRARIITAAVAAGLPRPPQAVYMRVRDLEGFRRSCRRGRELGHLGRVAIHPDQLAPIEEAYLPTRNEVAEARATIATVAADGVGMVGESFVDAAMLGAARTTIALADAYGVA